MQAGREAAATHHHSNHDAACMVCRFLEIPSSMMEAAHLWGPAARGGRRRLLRRPRSAPASALRLWRCHCAREPQAYRGAPLCSSARL